MEYTYDAWGKLLTTNSSMEGHVVEYNPLRYRGYVYDTETELYYLQSRYYNPKIGRFINADALVSTGQGLLGNNMFAYCRNSPLCRSDFSGYYDQMGIGGPKSKVEAVCFTGAGGAVGAAGSAGVIILTFPILDKIVDTTKQTIENLGTAIGHKVQLLQKRLKKTPNTGKPIVVAVRYLLDEE